MVRLSKIYTRGGDQGMTSLGGGDRVAKHDPRMDAIGDVDETNAAVGLVRLHATGEADDMLARIQHDLLDVGADLARPAAPGPGKPGTGPETGPETGPGTGNELRVVESQIERLEREIDALNEKLDPLDSFVLPGGEPAAAYLHLARTVARRAERKISRLTAGDNLNPLVLTYMNRLSDHFFVLGRHLNDDGEKDVLWVPGLNR